MKPTLLIATFVAAAAGRLAADDWPQWRGPQRDGVWRETGVLDRFPAAQIAIKWRAAISAGFSGPTVANGRVYVSDRVATITLNRPDAANALNMQMARDLMDVMLRCDDDPAVRAVVLLSGKEEHFCAGADIALLSDVSRAGAARDEAESASPTPAADPAIRRPIPVFTPDNAVGAIDFWFGAGI